MSDWKEDGQQRVENGAWEGGDIKLVAYIIGAIKDLCTKGLFLHSTYQCSNAVLRVTLVAPRRMTRKECRASLPPDGITSLLGICCIIWIIYVRRIRVRYGSAPKLANKQSMSAEYQMIYDVYLHFLQHVSVLAAKFAARPARGR